MGSRYLTGLADWCRSAGLAVVEVDGWQTRARSSGGFDGDRPWCCMWHHTASDTSPENDVGYIVHGCPDAPVSNLYLDRDGIVWVCAAGATNTNGKGGPHATSRGVVPADQMNTHAVSIEAANNGVGQLWAAEQIDAYFLLSNTLTIRLGLTPEDVCTHAVWAPSRKIDPATAGAVSGDWWPRSTNSSGTWNLADIQVEAERRADWTPPPDPGPPLPGPNPNPPREDDAMMIGALDTNGTLWVGDGITRLMVADPGEFDRRILVHGARFVNTSGAQIRGWPDVGVADGLTLDAIGRPG